MRQPKLQSGLLTGQIASLFTIHFFIMHTPVSFLVIYTFAVLTPTVQVVDTIIQWLTVQHKSWSYIFGRITYLSPLAL